MTLLASDDRGERVYTVDTVTQQIRGGGDSGTCLPGKFVPPALNFQAETLTELVDWGTTTLTEPVLITFPSSKELQACKGASLRAPETWQYHSQDIQRAAKNVSEACQEVVDQGKRPAWIRCSEVSHRTISRRKTKADFLVLLDL